MSQLNSVENKTNQIAFQKTSSMSKIYFDTRTNTVIVVITFKVFTFANVG